MKSSQMTICCEISIDSGIGLTILTKLNPLIVQEEDQKYSLNHFQAFLGHKYITSLISTLFD
jgi:hypothetical protein